MKKKIMYWGPYSGHVGTIKAQINSAHSMACYGGHEVILIRAHSEFKGYEAELCSKDIRLLDLGLSSFFPRLELSGSLARRPYMLVVAVFGFLPLIFALRKERPDMLILNLITIPALIACIVSGVKTIKIISIQGYPHFLGVKDEIVPLWKRVENIARKFLWNLVLPKANYLIAMTKNTKKKLEENTVLSKEQVKIISNPVIDAQVLLGKGKDAPHKWCHQSLPLIVGVGRLTKQKGFDVLIRAVSNLGSMDVEVRLIILGEGEERGELEQLIGSLNLSSQIALLGHVADPYPYIAHSNLFVLSSRWEDPGHAIIEAAALRVPIVTTNCPSGPSDLVGHGAGGWICENADADDMADKIKEALTDPDPSRLIVSEKNAKNYTLKSHYCALNSLLNMNY